MKTYFEIEKELSFVKQTFEQELSQALNLTKVSAPIAVKEGTGINDDLNGIERVVGFPVKQWGEERAVVVNSLAKWKRVKLSKLKAEIGQGIITDMRAIRPDEDYSPLHSIYVDQWDWEKVISRTDRNLKCLKTEVQKIYQALKATETELERKFKGYSSVLPDKITFIHAEELLAQYPLLESKERENEIVKKHGAVFLIGIGGALSNGEPHDGRAPDYDDWSTINEEGFKGLNGDILLYHPLLDRAFEISSMGIRVDPTALEKQLSLAQEEHRKGFLFHQQLFLGQLPQTIGGGIGQSRICMYFLRKKHIGEVQVGLWSDEILTETSKLGLELL